MVIFTARRNEPELVTPARLTPRESKMLSDLDDQWTLRYYETVVLFFRVCPKMAGLVGRNNIAAKVIKAAVAEVLVYYYPVAGRLRALLPGGNKLAVNCKAEWVVFVEATADVRLEELGEPLLPPYPCVGEFLGYAGDTRAILDKPLLLLQVTRLKCGGFVIGFHTCHNIADGFGMIQFMKAITDLAHIDKLSIVAPVWKRDILTARIPPRITYMNSAYKSLLNDAPDGDSSKHVILSTPPEAMVNQFFLFSATDIASLRTYIPEHLAQSTSTFEILTAMAWRCRTAALGYQKSQRVHLIFTLNVHGRCSGGVLPIPQGYFGNALFYPLMIAMLMSYVGSHLSMPLSLCTMPKSIWLWRSMRSMVNVMSLQQELPPIVMERTYIVADTRWLGEDKLDFGWAERVGGDIPVPMLAGSMGMSEYMKCKNTDGEDSTVVRMHLPRPTMDSFAKEIKLLLNKF